MTERHYDLAGKRVFVAGHRGMVGAALVRRLQSENCAAILTAGRETLDLTRQSAVESWMRAERPDAVFVAAARVGGILANDSFPADFLIQNLQIQTNVIAAAAEFGVARLVFLGSSCIYPRDAAQPMREDALLTGPLEPTNQWYAVAKIAGLKMVEALRRQHGCNYVSAMPTNLYGPGDNYDLERSHVIPALLRKAHLARERGDAAMEIWGSGAPLREFLHADDCADALVFVMTSYCADEHINIGSGVEISIEALARLVMRVVGFDGALRRDLSKPDGTPRKLMDCARLHHLGWRPRIALEAGLADTYRIARREWARAQAPVA